MHVKNQAAEQQLREEFKKINWWARNESFEGVVVLLSFIAFGIWSMIADTKHFLKRHPYIAHEIDIVLIGCVLILAFGAIVSMSRHFFEEVPWQKYKKLHMPPKQEDEDDLSMSG